MTFGAPMAIHAGDKVSPDPGDLSIVAKDCRPPDVLSHNIARAMARGLPRFFGVSVKSNGPAWHVKWQQEPIAIIGGGPSLKDTIEEARKFRVTMVCGTAHDFVVESGIIPTYVAILDPQAINVDWLKFPQQETTYLLASRCDPAMFDCLRDYNVQLWHALAEEIGEGFCEPSVGGGCTIGLRATELALLLGHWDQHFFGFDSSHREAADSHAYHTYPPPPQKATVRVGEREFHTDLGMLAQAEHFVAQFKMRKHMMRATIHGDGLLAEMVRGANGKYGIHLA